MSGTPERNEGGTTPFLFGTARPTPHYFLFLGLALAAILVAWQLVHSRVGVYLRAIRDYCSDIWKTWPVKIEL